MSLVAKTHDPLKLLLVDDEFRARLDPADRSGDDVATVLLERVSLSGDVDKLGSVHLQADQTWLAAILGGPDEFVVVALVADRFDAIVALWRHRREAFLGRLAL
jgi:hypothetical protein